MYCQLDRLGGPADQHPPRWNLCPRTPFQRVAVFLVTVWWYGRRHKTLEAIFDIAIPAAVCIIMVSIGFGVTRDDILGALAVPKAFWIGVTAQLMLVPVFVLLFLILLQPEREIALGMMILALCPGGALSNILTKVSGGNVALSVSMTAFTNVFAVATLPISSALAAGYFVGADVNAAEIRAITVQVALIGTVPILLGMALRYVAPDLAARHGAAFFGFSLVVFVLIMGWSIMESMNVFYAAMIELGWQLLTLLCVLLALGVAVGRVGGLTLPHRITLIFEIGVQNSALGIAVGGMMWRGTSGFPIYATPAAVYGSLTLLLLLPFVAIVSRLSKTAVTARN